MEGIIHKENTKKKDDDEEEQVTKKNPVRKIIDMCEQLFIFGIFYIHSSPLQPLMGPGCANPDNFFLVHACYYAILLFVPMAYTITNLPVIRAYLSNDAHLCIFVENKDTCLDIVSDLFTNRFSLAVASLFLFMSLVTMKCFATNEYTRPSLHNGFWILKLMFIFVVSLIAFSIPPTLFDSLWQYICELGTIIQTLLITFLLLDWTNAITHEKQLDKENSKHRTQKTILYGSVSIVFLSSIAGIIYMIHYSIKHRGFLLVDIVLLLLPLKAIIIIFLFAKRVASSMLQSTVILCYILFRFGLFMAYGIPCLPVCRAYMLIDTNFKIVTVAYGLFRHLRRNQYTVNGSSIYGCAPRTYLAYSDKNLNDYHQNTQDINVTLDAMDHGMDNSKSRDEKSSLKGATRIPDSEEKDPIGVSGEEANMEKRLDTKGKNQCSSSVHDYSYSFLHFFLLTACLDINADLTSFKVVEERKSKFELNGCHFSVLILNMSSIIIAITFTWSKTMKKFYEDADEYSITTLIQTFAKSAVNLVTRVMTESPIPIIKVKYMYIGLLFLYLTISMLFFCPAVQIELEKSPILCSQKTKQGKCLTTDPRFVVMNQVSLSLATFFFILTILLLGVTTSRNPRHIIHYGFWPSKLLFLGLIFTFSFYLPLDVGSIWTHMTLVATLLVTLLQTVVVLDCTSQILDYIRLKKEDTTYPNKIYFSCSSIAVFLYTLTITAFFCFYVYFAQFSACKSNRIFISINLLLCILASLVSLHPFVQTGGLVQSAIMTSFCMYCTWTALYNNPREKCNPMSLIIFESEIKPTRALLFTTDIVALIATIIYVTVYTRRIEDFLKRFMFICFKRPVITSDFLHDPQKSSNNLTQMSFQDALLGKQRGDYSLPPIQKDLSLTDHQDLRTTSNSIKKMDLDLEKSENDASQYVGYNLSLFHVTCSLLVMHLFTLMITWTDERLGSNIYVSFHWAIMCVKMVASCASVLLYIWSLAVHLFWNTSCRYSNSCLKN